MRYFKSRLKGSAVGTIVGSAAAAIGVPIFCLIKWFTSGENLLGLGILFFIGGAIGVVIKFEADDAAKNNAGFAEFAKNIALQTAAYPVEYLNREAVPASRIAEEREIIKSQIDNDEKNAKKPEQIKEKMVDGKIGKFYEANCLLEQAYVKDDSMNVQKYVDTTAKEFGGHIAVVGFVRYEKGEGIQKREENFADEISKMVNN